MYCIRSNYSDFNYLLFKREKWNYDMFQTSHLFFTFNPQVTQSKGTPSFYLLLICPHTMWNLMVVA
jgi:hypothetical protein